MFSKVYIKKWQEWSNKMRFQMKKLAKARMKKKMKNPKIPALRKIKNREAVKKILKLF
jgi:hypothetical protein